MLLSSSHSDNILQRFPFTFRLVLLLWSNYSMYNRLNSLEELHARYSADDIREIHPNE